MTLDQPVSEDLILDVISMIFGVSVEKSEIHIKNGSNVGEGFLGITSIVEVKIGEKIRNLFIKMLPENKKIRNVLNLDGVFDREVSFYSELYRILNDVSTKNLKKRFDITPRCLLVKTDYLKEALVFDDIGVCGYATRKGKELLDKNHVMLALKKYSYLHACGFLFKRDYPEKFEEMKKSKPDLFFKTLEMYDIPKLSLFCLNILKRHCTDIEDNIILNNFDTIKAKTLKVEQYMNSPKEYSTIIHTDCWINNLMFKYKNNLDEPEDLKIVDMQMWSVNSPVFDILHVIYTNTSEKKTLDDLDFFFDYYYETLCNIISEMGENPDILYPREVFLSHLENYSFYGFFMACLTFRVLLADHKDIPNTAKMILDGKPITEAFIYDLPDEKDYAKRLKLILCHFMKNNIF